MLQWHKCTSPHWYLIFDSNIYVGPSADSKGPRRTGRRGQRVPSSAWGNVGMCWVLNMSPSKWIWCVIIYRVYIYMYTHNMYVYRYIYIHIIWLVWLAHCRTIRRQPKEFQWGRSPMDWPRSEHRNDLRVFFFLMMVYSYGHLSVISTEKTPFIECIIP